MLPGNLTTSYFFRFCFSFFFSLRRYSHGFQISSSICHHLILQYSSFQRVGKSIASLIKGILIFIESKGIRARKDPCKFFFFTNYLSSLPMSQGLSEGESEIKFYLEYTCIFHTYIYTHIIKYIRFNLEMKRIYL